MSIKIVLPNEERKYSEDLDLLEQLSGASKVVIDYEPKNSSIDSFFNKMASFIKNGKTTNVNIEIVHINNEKQKKVARLSSGSLKINEIVKAITFSYLQSDKKLEEMAEICKGGHGE